MKNKLKNAGYGELNRYKHPQKPEQYAPVVKTLNQNEGLCYEPLSVLEPWKRRAIKCKLVKTKSMAAAASLPSNSTADRGNVNKNILKVDLSCRASNQQLCEDIRTAMTSAGIMLGNILNIANPLYVNATFINFCSELGKCATEKFTLLGGAAPARSFLLTDVDGMTRSFPQALLKQLRPQEHPEYSHYDISALFNTEADWWFAGNGQIKPDQHDFLFVVLHELIHGLGFTSAWNDYINDTPLALTPNPLAPGQSSDEDKAYLFTGFYENAFDRFLVEIPSMEPLSNYTKMLNGFAFGNSSTNLTAVKNVIKNYTNQDDFIQHFTASPAYQKVSTKLLSLATEKGRLGFRPDDGDPTQVIVMETNIGHFVMGSSIMHVDYEGYQDKPDFLMRFLQDPGKTLTDCVDKAGNPPGGALGPQLRRMLSALGYPVNQRPQLLAEMYRVSAATTSLERGGWSWWLMIMTVVALLNQTLLQ